MSDTEPYTSPEEMRYLEQDEAWDNYAQTSAPTTTSLRRKPRVRRARQQFVPSPTALPAMPITADAGVCRIIVNTAIVTVCVVAILLKSQCNCFCTLTI